MTSRLNIGTIGGMGSSSEKSSGTTTSDEPQVEQWHPQRIRNPQFTPTSTLSIEAQSDIDEPDPSTMPQAIIANWSLLASSNLQKRMFSKILRFAQRPESWRGPGSRALTADAVRAFAVFWGRVHRSSLEPTLTLTHTGGIHAQWHKSDREHMDLLFQSTDQVFFGLFDRDSVYEGVDNLQNVVQLLMDHPNEPLRWKEK